jgi:hypothetical protein
MSKPENYHDLQIRLINENKKSNPWIVYLKAYSQYHKISYRQAMKEAAPYYYQQNKIFTAIPRKDEKDDSNKNNIFEYNKMTTTVKIKTSNPWVSFVRKYAQDNNLSYACAVSNPECSLLYKQSKEIPKLPKKYNLTVKGKTPQEYMKYVKHSKKQKDAQSFLLDLATKIKQEHQKQQEHKKTQKEAQNFLSNLGTKAKLITPKTTPKSKSKPKPKQKQKQKQKQNIVEVEEEDPFAKYLKPEPPAPAPTVPKPAPAPTVPNPASKSKLNIIEINEMLTDYMQLSKNIQTRDDLNRFNKIYKKLSLKLHPDKLVNEPVDRRNILIKKFQEINHAKDMINKAYEDLL